jgi:hypothetical protein
MHRTLFRTLKEKLLWIHRLRNLVELRVALMEFRDRYSPNGFSND